MRVNFQKNVPNLTRKPKNQFLSCLKFKNTKTTYIHAINPDEKGFWSENHPKKFSFFLSARKVSTFFVKPIRANSKNLMSSKIQNLKFISDYEKKL